MRDLVETRGPLPLAEAVSYMLPGGRRPGPCRRPRRGPSRHQAFQHPDYAGWAVKLIDMGLARLREAENPAPGPDRQRHDPGHLRLHLARAGPRSPKGRRPQRHLFAGLHLLLHAHRPAAFPEGTVLQKLLQHQGDQPPDVRRSARICRTTCPACCGRCWPRIRGSGTATPTSWWATCSPWPRRSGWNRWRLAATFGSPVSRRPAAAERHLPWVVPVTSLVAIVALLNVFVAPVTGDSGPPLIAELATNRSAPRSNHAKKNAASRGRRPAGKAHASVSASGSRSGSRKRSRSGPGRNGHAAQDLVAAKSPRLRSRVPQPGERTLLQADQSPLPQPDERVLPRPAEIAAGKPPAT